MPYETAEIHGAFIDLLNGFLNVHLDAGNDVGGANASRTAYVMTPMEQGVGDGLQVGGGGARAAVPRVEPFIGVYWGSLTFTRLGSTNSVC